ncbi:transcription factor [Cryptococcus neoformans var. grubii Br795]|nr:transcription factor [Cryptococcus neoformans var. grubii MW-RSA36]OXG83011.1 transcription factor [Cryptococcus neoformans var. grubii Br795]OXL08447.1 transcription factor [Cryptococcus neoformans var. grubii Gb118]
MEGFDLPMSFGKKSKAGNSNLKAKVENTKRADIFTSVKGEELAKEVPQPPLSTTGRKADAEEDDNEEEIGPIPPSATGKRKAEESDVSDDEQEAEEEVDRLPISHEIILKDHTKVVSALAVDPSGARIATGSHDYDTKLWDFGGMDHRLKPFKSFEANGNYYVHDLSYSPDGQQLLVISGTVQPKVFNRNGEDEMEFNKGDVYLRDMKNTNGHTAEINAGAWHPTDKSIFLTCSNDSTLRIWDTSNKRKQKQVIVVKSKERGARTKVTACAWSSDGKWIAGVCLDGTLHIWDTSSNFARPKYSCEDAHPKNTETTGVTFSRDGLRVATRGGDDTVKLWDIRSIRKPLAVAKNLDNLYPETNLIFSPDDTQILTGTAAPKGQKGGLVFLNSKDLKEERRIAIGDGSVVRVLWHSRINQIFATLSTGGVHVLYSPSSSIHGALLPLAKLPKTAPRDPSFSTVDLKPVIYTPDALPMYQEQGHRESLHQKEKKAKKMKPMEPVSGVGRAGRLGASETQSFVHSMYPETLKFEDPREALLKYASKEEQEKKKQEM